MLPRKNEVGRKPEDVERSKEIVRELEKMEKVDIQGYGRDSKTAFFNSKREVAGGIISG